MLEADVASHQDRIEGVKITADQFVDGGHFDADNIHAKQVCTQFCNFSEKFKLILNISFLHIRLYYVIVIPH